MTPTSNTLKVLKICSITLKEKGTFYTSANLGVWTVPKPPRYRCLSTAAWCHPKAALQGLQLLHQAHIFAPKGGKGSTWDGASLLNFTAHPEKAKVDKSVREGPAGMARREGLGSVAG